MSCGTSSSTAESKHKGAVATAAVLFIPHTAYTRDHRRHMEELEQMVDDSVPTPVIAAVLTTAPAWVSALEHVNVILAFVIAILGLIIGVVKVKRAILDKSTMTQNDMERLTEKISNDILEREQELVNKMHGTDRRLHADIMNDVRDEMAQREEEEKKKDHDK